MDWRGASTKTWLQLLCLIAAAAVRAQGTWAPDGWEHLDVEPGTFAQSYSAEGEVELSRLLLPDPYRTVQMVTQPGFDEGESAVYVLPIPMGARVILKRLPVGYGAAVKALLGTVLAPRVHTLAEARIAKSQIKEMVVTHEAPLSTATHGKLLRAWRLALADARVQRKRAGAVAKRYRFAQYESGDDYRSGETWTPREGTPCAALVQLGEHLAAFVELPEEKRAEADATLGAEADAVAGRFASGEVTRGR